MQARKSHSSTLYRKAHDRLNRYKTRFENKKAKNHHHTAAPPSNQLVACARVCFFVAVA